MRRNNKKAFALTTFPGMEDSFTSSSHRPAVLPPTAPTASDTASNECGFSTRFQPSALMLAERFVYIESRLLHISGNTSPPSLRGPPVHIGSLYCKLRALNPPVSVTFSLLLAFNIPGSSFLVWINT